MRVCVTGATGFIGSCSAQNELLVVGQFVVGIDDRDRARALLLPVGTQFTPGIHQRTLIAPAPAELT